MLARGSAVELVDPDLLAAQVVRVPGVVLDVKPEIGSGLLGFLHRGVRREEAGRETVRDRHGTQVSVVMCAFVFMGLVSKKKKKNCAPRGEKLR